MLLVVSGLPGTGKTAVARAVADRLTAVHLSIDPVENAMLGAGAEKGWTAGVSAYEAVRAMAEDNLTRGLTVVVDAVNDSEAARDTWRRAAGALPRCGRDPRRRTHLGAGPELALRRTSHGWVRSQRSTQVFPSPR